MRYAICYMMGTWKGDMEGYMDGYMLYGWVHGRVIWKGDMEGYYKKPRTKCDH